jgi:3-oxoacyl-(acyl-carrier-protein) synthase/acyl carrier protein
LNACRPHDALSGCIDLTAFDPDPSWREAIVTFLQAQIDRHRLSGLRLIQVCHKLHAHEVDTTCLDGADLAGLYRTIGAEYPRVDSRVLDTDEGLENPGQIRRQILDEWARGPARFGCCCYRNGRRFSAGLVPEARIGPDDDDADRAYPDGGVLLVTGGTRGVGRAMVDDAIARGVRKVAILGRDPIPPRAEWDRYPADSALGEKIAHFEAWMDQGVELEIYTGPLTDRDALVDFRQRIHRNLGSVFGVLHCAGLARTGHPAFIRKPIADMRAVCEPKIEGLQCLDAIFGDEPLDFFVLFSSVASALPTLGSGQSDYAMANAYMDYFARHRFSQGRRHYRSIQWPNWDGIGMGGATSAAYGATGLLSHTRAEGIGLFRRALAVDVPVVLPCVHRGALDWAGTTPEEGRAAVVGSRSIRQWIDDLFARELKLSPGQLEPDTPFIELGLDSILMAELVRAMERGLKIPLDPSLLFEHTTLNRLVDFLGDRVPPMPDAPTAAPAAAPAPAPMTLASGVSSGTRILPDNPPAAPVSLRKRETDDIAIVGLSCRFPQAPDPEAFWNLLRRGETAMGPVPPERWNQIDPQWFGGFLNNLDLFDPGFFSLADDDARVMGPQARILLEESIGALYEAGYDERTFEGRNVGVYVGARAMVIPAVETLRDAPNPILGLGQNYLAANVSRFLDLRGPSLVIDTACSSALVAMHAAVLALRRGDIDCALVGGVSVLANDESHRLFASRNLLRPDGVFHLFDRRADGVVLGEGAGCLVLKRLADATAEGNRVRAVVRGIAVNNNGRTAGPNAPNLEAQVQVVSAALRDAGMSGSEISAVETSGAGSQIPDLVELKSLAYALGRPDPASRIRYLGSVKANIGHLLSGAGLASFIKAVLGLQAGELPPFISGQEAPEHFDLDRAGFGFNRQVEHWPSIAGVRAAAVQSFPDGGTNCAVIVASFSDGPEPGEPSRGRPAFVKKRLSVDPSGTDESITDKILSGTNGDDFWGFDA